MLPAHLTRILPPPSARAAAQTLTMERIIEAGRVRQAEKEVWVPSPMGACPFQDSLRQSLKSEVYS